MIRALEKISNLLNKWFLWVGGAALLIMMGISCANMLLRPFGVPLKGAYELAGFLGALTIALPLGYAQITRSHISVDILAAKMSKRAQRIMYGISSFFSMIFFALVGWQVFIFATTIWKRSETSETLRIIYHPFIYAVAFCCALLSFVLLIDFLKSLTPEKGGK